MTRPRGARRLNATALQLALAGSLLLACVGCGSGSSGSNSGGAAGKSASGPTAKGDPTRGGEVAKMTCSHLSTCHVEKSLMQAPMLPDAMKLVRDKTSSYEQLAAQLKIKDRALYDKNQAEIDAIASVTDPDGRTRQWLRSFLRNPRFDNRNSRMIAPAPPLPDQDLADVIEYLMALP